MSQFDPSNVDVERMAKETGVPAWEIKEAIGVPEEPLATTIEAVRQRCNLATAGSQAKKAALEKLNGLCLERVEHVTTIAEAWGLCRQVAVGSEAEKAAFAKLNGLCLEKLTQVTTTKETKELCLQAPVGSEAKKAIVRRLAELFLKES